MKHASQSFTLCLLALLITHNLCADPVSARERSAQKPLKIVYTEFPPYTYTNKQGESQSYFVELISSLLERRNIPHNFSSHPTPRIHFQLKSDEADIYLGPQDVPNLQQHIRIIPLPHR